MACWVRHGIGVPPHLNGASACIFPVVDASVQTQALAEPASTLASVGRFRRRAIQSGVSRLDGLDMALICLFLIGMYTNYTIMVSAKVPFPSAPSGVAGLILLWRRRDSPRVVACFLYRQGIYENERATYCSTSASGRSSSLQNPPASRSQVCNRLARSLALPFQGEFSKGSTLARIEWPKPARWRDVLWLLMTAAGALLLAYAVLSA